MRAREPDAIDPGNRVNGAQQLTELGAHFGHQITAPRVDVLAQKGHLAYAVVGKARHFGDDIARTAALLPTANRRNDAVGTDGVAAHRNLHPGLKGALSPRGQLTGEVLPLGKAPS